MAKSEVPYIIQVQNFIEKKWNFRFNEVLGRIEFSFNNSEEYSLMSEYDFNSILTILAESELPYSATNLKKLLESKYVKKFNPFHSYLKGLETWDGEIDYISQLASTINTTNDELWHIAFKKWVVAMVGALLDDNVINHTMLVLSGGQGLGKTTWLNNLVPKELEKYHFTGAINPNNKDSQIQLAENMLINIDELQGLRANDIEALKALITSKDIKIRRPYAVNHDNLPHRASFVGSVNSQHFLSDVTGNRRFLCFEVSSIQYDHDVLLDKVYAQAKYLFENGFQYWFSQEDIATLNLSNEDFRIRNMEEELLFKYFEPCEKDDEQAVFLATTEIMNTLAKLADIKFDGRNVFRLGKILSQFGFIKDKVKNRYGYYLKFKESDTDTGYGYADTDKH
ncbi:MAG: VapE domain-containing protein [Dysgonomonas sp.]